MAKRLRIFQTFNDKEPFTFCKPRQYAKLKSENFALHRPPSIKTLPLALLHNIFEQFVESVQTYQPTAVDNALVLDLRHVMSRVHSSERDLCKKFRETVKNHDEEIRLEAAGSRWTAYTSEGHPEK